MNISFPLYVNRPEIVEKIRVSISNNRITNIYGLPGIGKTTICNFCLDEYFYDTDQIIVNSDRNHNDFQFNLGKTCIYVFENFDYLDLNEDIINFINSFNPYAKFVIISRNKINQFKDINTIEIPPFTINEIYDLILKKLNYKKIYNNILKQKIMEISGGNPLFANFIIEYIIKNELTDIDTLKTIYKPCIIDKYGKPIEKIDNSTQIIVTEINDDLLYKLSKEPNLLYNLLPYDFERVIARMFEKKGFTVKITPQTRDGGKDIFIAKNDLCSFLFYVECKKYAPDQHVGIDVIQRLYGVISAEKATGGIIATTSYFTKPAKNYIQENHLEHQLTLQDYDTISSILKSL